MISGLISIIAGAFLFAHLTLTLSSDRKYNSKEEKTNSMYCNEAFGG